MTEEKEDNGPLIFERVGSIIYARYMNRRDIPRWVYGEYTEKKFDKEQ